MAEIFTKSTTAGNENCLITDFREGFRYPFKIQDWTRMKFCMAWSYTAANGNDNMDGFGQALITTNSPRDYMYLGIKKYSQKFPGEADDEYLLGISTRGTFSSIDFPVAFFFPFGSHGQNLDIGVKYPDGTYAGTSQTNFVLTGSNQFDDTSDFGGMMAFDVTIINKGQSNQQVNVKYARQGLTSNTRATCETFMNSATYTDLGDLTFNNNGVPYAMPDSFFMYLPFGNIRLRTFALQAIRIS